MGISVFRIILDKQNGVFYSGETLTGKVMLVLDASKALDAMYVTLSGVANVSWDERPDEDKFAKNRTSEDNADEITKFSSEQTFFTITISLIGNCGITTHLPAGKNEFPFTYALPQNLPTSFEGDYGHIRYTIRAVLDRSWTFNQDAKLAFSVISLIDLNTMPVLKKSMNQEKSKTMCCFCCASGPLAVSVYVPFCGVVPGQELPVSVDVENSTNVSIKQVQCTLVQHATYIANTPYTKRREKERKMNTLELGRLDKNSSNSWEKVLVIPPCPTTLQRYCNIINVEYFLKVIVVPSGCHTSLDIHIPITVGTVPLRFHTETPSAPMADPRSQVYPTAAAIHQLPPPSYEKCVFGATSITDGQDTKYTYGVKEFAPVYPVYRI